MNDYVRVEKVNDVIRYIVCQGEGDEKRACKTGTCAACGMIDIMNAVSGIKPENVRPVVYCKDCIYRGESYLNNGCIFADKVMSDSGFCSFGRKKSEV